MIYHNFSNNNKTDRLVAAGSTSLTELVTQSKAALDDVTQVWFTFLTIKIRFKKVSTFMFLSKNKNRLAR